SDLYGSGSRRRRDRLGARELGELRRGERRPRLDGAEWGALMRGLCVAPLRTDVNAALQQPLLDHRAHVHERLYGDALDALGHELAEAASVAEQRVARETDEGGEAEVAALADVAEELCQRRMGERALFAQEPEQRFLGERAELGIELRISDAVRHQVEVRLEPFASYDRDERFPFAAV